MSFTQRGVCCLLTACHLFVLPLLLRLLHLFCPHTLIPIAATAQQPCIRRGQQQQWTSGVVKAAMRGAPYDKLVAAATINVSLVCFGGGGGRAKCGGGW